MNHKKVEKAEKITQPIKQKILTSKTIKKIEYKNISKTIKNVPDIQKTTKKSNYNEKLFEFVKNWEWNFQSKAFCDSYYKTKKWLIRKSWKDCTKWSIWFWTNSYWWETITYDEAIKRKNEAILARNNLITSKCLTDNQKIVTVDFMYQYSSKYANQIRYYANTCKINNIYQYIVSCRDYYKTKNQWGLVKREQKRINLFWN